MTKEDESCTVSDVQNNKCKMLLELGIVNIAECYLAVTLLGKLINKHLSSKGGVDAEKARYC